MYIHINMTPDGTNKKDCVLRALTYALDLPYMDVLSYLEDFKKYTNSSKYNCSRNVIRGISDLLGYNPTITKKQSITTFIKNNPKGLYIVLVKSHLTVVHNSDIIDTWDCGRCFVKCYWEVNWYFF